MCVFICVICAVAKRPCLVQVIYTKGKCQMPFTELGPPKTGHGRSADLPCVGWGPWIYRIQIHTYVHIYIHIHMCIDNILYIYNVIHYIYFVHYTYVYIYCVYIYIVSIYIYILYLYIYIHIIMITHI